MLAGLAIAWMSLIGALLFRALTQYRFYEIVGTRPWRRFRVAAPVAFIVPARNEAQNIERCVRSLLSQDYPNFEVIVVNDNSTDATGQIVEQLAASDSRLRVINAQELPEGWAGKPHACWLGASAATGRWLCFVDADTIASPFLLSAAVMLARLRKLDMLSLEPFQELGSFWERVIIPAGMFLMAFSQDLRRINDPARPDAAANGQFILIRRSVYQELCGHSAVRAAICEDTALARLVKARGRRIALMGAEGLIRTRMYTGLKPLWEGLSKNVVEMAGGCAGTAFVAGLAVLIAMASVTFPALALHAYLSSSVITGSDVAVCEGLLGSAVLFGTHIAGALHFGIPWWYGLLFPLGYCTGALIALNSVVLRMRGKVTWKGRSLRAA